MDRLSRLIRIEEFAFRNASAAASLCEKSLLALRHLSHNLAERIGLPNLNTIGLSLERVMDADQLLCSALLADSLATSFLCIGLYSGAEVAKNSSLPPNLANLRSISTDIRETEFCSILHSRAFLARLFILQSLPIEPTRCFSFLVWSIPRFAISFMLFHQAMCIVECMIGTATRTKRLQGITVIRYGFPMSFDFDLLPPSFSPLCFYMSMFLFWYYSYGYAFDF